MACKAAKTQRRIYRLAQPVLCGEKRDVGERLGVSPPWIASDHTEGLRPTARRCQFVARADSLLRRHVFIKPVGKTWNIQDHRWPAVFLAGASFKSHIESFRDGLVSESL